MDSLVPVEFKSLESDPGPEPGSTVYQLCGERQKAWKVVVIAFLPESCCSSAEC